MFFQIGLLNHQQGFDIGYSLTNYLRVGSTANMYFVLFAKCIVELGQHSIMVKQKCLVGDFADHFLMSCAGARTKPYGKRVANNRIAAGVTRA